MAKPTAASETWSVASSEIVDTRSEPPRYGRSVVPYDHAQQQPAQPTAKAKGSSTMSLEDKLSRGPQSRNNSVAGSQAGSVASKATGTKIKKGKKSEKSVKTEKSSVRTEKTAATKGTTKTVESKSKPKASSSRRGSSKSSQAPSHAPSRDPEESHSNNHAIVPRASREVVQPPSREIQHAAVDPPSGASTSGSSTACGTGYGTGYEEAAGYVHDPPCGNSTVGESTVGNTTVGDSTAGGTTVTGTTRESTRGSTYADTTTIGSTTMDGYTQGSTIGTSENFGYARIYQPKTDQLATWKEREDEGTEASQSVDDTTTYYSRPGDRSKATKSSYSRSSSRSSSEESYYSGDDGDTTERGSELASAVEKALAIRENRSQAGTASVDEAEARALVKSDFHGGVNSYYEGVDGDGQLVKSEGKYLAKAVDNLQAVVPIDSAIYEAYDHTFVTCPEQLRFRFLYTFLKKNLDKKVMIFFSTANSAKYHAKLLERFKIPVLTMHGKQKRERFIGIFFKFSDLDEGILCATDAAGRDLDIPPSVDWVIQFEPPEDPSEYIMRVARISCDSDRVGRSLLFLNPGEQGFLKYYHSASIPVSEFEIPERLADVQSHIEHIVSEDERLLRYARDAYGSYMIAYASHGFRDVYNVHDLTKTDVAAAFGLVGPLQVAADDMTTDTGTLATEVTEDFKGEPRKSKSGRGQWEKKEKAKSKTWMRGEKSWPHSQIKMHPKFKQGGSSGASMD